MLDDDLFDLYELQEEQKIIKNKILDLKFALQDNKENASDLKTRIINDMNNRKHKFVVYKDLTLSLVKKPEKIKMDKSEIKEEIEKIIEMETVDKGSKILELLKPKESGVFRDVLIIRFNKRK